MSVRLDEVVISQRGGGHAQRLAVMNVQASWELNSTGTFSAFCRLADLRARGLSEALAGAWLTWDHPTLGRWGGVITGRPTDNAVAEITADGWAALLRGRILSEQDQPPPGQAGGIARRVVQAAAREQPTFITLGAIDEGGPALSAVIRVGDVIRDVLPALVEAGQIEWLVDAERRFHAGRQVGRDRSGVVRLVEDRHITSARFDEDLWRIGTGERLLVESRSALSQRQVRRSRSGALGSATVTAVGAIGQGAAADTLRNPGAGLVQVAESSPTMLLLESRDTRVEVTDRLATIPIQLELADVERCWADFTVADIVCVELGRAGLFARVKVVVRAVDVAAGSLAVGGEILLEEAA